MFETLTRRSLMMAIAATLIAATTVAPVTAGEERSYLLATATTGGTYYPVGVALSTLTKVKLRPKEKISMSAITSAGSSENVKLLRDNQAQFAILQGLYGAWAWTGTGEVAAEGPQKNLRSVTMLWQNVEHFVIRSEDVTTGTAADLSNLKGRKFSIGEQGSGAEGSGRTILVGLGIDPDKTFDVVYLGYNPSADALQDGTVDGMNTPAGVPVPAVTRAATALGDKIRVLDFTAEEMATVNKAAGFELWTRFVVPAETYPGQSKEIATIAQPNFLAVRDDVDEDAVYAITKTIYENLGFIQAIHKATDAMAIDKAIVGLPFPLHPGAARYYKEQGLSIPARLIAG